MTCPRCRQDTLPGATLCPKCGASLRPSARRQRPTGIGPNLNAIAKTAARLCDAQYAQILLVEGNQVRVVAKYGSLPGTRRLGQMDPLTRDTATGSAILDRRTVHIRDLKAGIKGQYKATAARQAATGIRTLLATPLLHEGTPLGTIVIHRTTVRPFTSKQIALLGAFAEHAATAIEKTRLAQVLAEALEQQTATSEILRVISSSPTDLQPVLDAIAASAARLCDSIDAQIFRIDGEVLRIAASYGALPKTTPADSRPIDRGSVNGRAVVDRRTIHIHDLAAESDSEWPVAKAYQKRFGHRTTLATPLLREGVPLGAITIRRMEVRPFSDKQISLLETFADQAVIAIENVRLFTELQEKNRALTRAHAQMSEALEQQTATSEVLKVISRSTFDLEPVLATLIESAARLSGATQGFIFKFDGEFLRLAADYGTPAEHRDYWRENLLRPGPSSNSGRAAFERRTVHTHDALAQSEADPLYEHSQAQKVGGYRTVLAIPMLREEVLVGVLTIWKTKVEPFTDRQVELVESFADQAGIAIENVRLFNELEARNSALTEALEQQTATSEILRAIAGSPTDLQPVLDAVVQNAARVCGAFDGVLALADGDTGRIAAHCGPIAATLGRKFPLTRGSVMGRAVIDRQTVHVHDLAEADEAEFPEGRALARRTGHRTTLGTPLLREGVAIGSLLIRRTELRPFTDKQIELLKTFADQAVIAIENVRLFKELEARNRDLTEALEQQTATGEILGVISRSPTDIQPIFDVIVRNAVRLSDALFSTVILTEGDALQLGAAHGFTGKALATLERSFPASRDIDLPSGQAIREGSVVQLPDAQASRFGAWARALGMRSYVSVPMFRGGQAIGAIAIARREAGPFSDRQISLLRTFADQAVIAIENVRLFRDLTEALEQQTATSEILRVISSSPTTLDPVLAAVVKTAARLCDANNASLYRVEGDLMRKVAGHGSVPTSIEVGDTRPVTSGTVTGRAMLERRTLHIPDLLAEVDTQDPVSRNYIRREGIRTFVATPLLREGVPIGAIAVYRTDVRPFSDKQIGLLQTFADQAVIAIENVRLFKELEARNRDLTEALEQQTATSEILRVISRSPTDVQPVFESIVDSAVRLCSAEVGNVTRFDGEWVHMAAMHADAAGIDRLRKMYPARPSGALASLRSIRDRAVVHIPDILEDEEYQSQQAATAAGFRAVLSVPMLRDDQAIGSLTVGRAAPGRFSDKQIALLQTFADQAVIAIENVRLFKELEARNRDLTEALEQQTATADILRVISASPTEVQPVFEIIAERAMKLCEAEVGVVSRLDGELIHLVAIHGWTPEDTEAVRRANPMPLSAGTVTARAIRNRAVVHIQDVLADPLYEQRALALKDAALAARYRLALGVPMVREGQVIGAIFVARATPGQFSDSQIELLKTFADQAVIAIENVRLFKELEARNRDLTEALEQQTATAEILRAISSSPTDIRPVLETLVHAAARFCGATNVGLLNLDGGVLRGAAAAGPMGEELVRSFGSIEAFEVPVNRGSVTGRAVSERRTVHVHDLAAEPENEFPVGREIQRKLGYRTLVATPLLREGTPIGAILLTRTEVKPFSDKQLELLRTFADQAVIAIENVRLFKELEARNDELTTALEQQTATAEILRVISSSPTDVQPVFDTILGRAVQLCGAEYGGAFRFDGNQIHFVAAHNMPATVAEIMKQEYPTAPTWSKASGRAILTREVVQIADILADADYGGAGVRAGGFRSILAVPMLREGNPIGAILIYRLEPDLFPEKQVTLLRTFADQAVIAIENVRLFKELEGRNRDLTESLEQQTATSEILRVISQSQTDVQPVFETVAANALRLCDATFSAVYRFDGELIHLAALHKVTPEGAAAIREAYPMPPGRGGANARAILTRGIVHIPDVREDPEYVLGGLAETSNFRSILSVPMLRDGHPIGLISVAAATARPFPDKQIALLQTFADQAVIAIENVRLFKELEARTGELTQSVEKLTALGEISRAVSSTLDVETVLNTIVSRASQLAGADGCSIYEYDKGAERFELRATHNFDAEFVEAIRAVPLRKGEGLMGRAAETREPVQIPDITQPGAYQSSVRDVLIRFGYRALLSVPLLREDQIIGSLSLNRKAPGTFPPEVIDLLKTFATQSALAIQNARLFREIEAKSRELEVASRHKSEFLANMSHELRTPLNAIIGYSEMVQEEAEGLGAEGLVPDLKKINSAGKHLLDLINSVLDLSKIEAGKMELYLETFSVPDMVRDIAGVVQTLAEKRSNRLQVRCDEGAGAMRADLTKVRQALFNLLSNACKFTERGTVSLTVGRDSTSAGEWLAFEVKDTGIGITPEQMTRLFHEFSQADAEVTRRYGGTGLGLALSRRLCRMMGGDISLESEAGRGSTFTIRLPASVAEPSAEAAAVGGAVRPATGTAGTVLVIDDDATVRDLMERFLDKEGFRVVTAAGGQEGLRLAKELRPDAITLDVMMPAMDGWAVLSALKSDPELSDIPVIMLTILDARNMGYALGASDYLTKPIDRDRLAAVLKKYRRDLPVLIVDDDADLRRRLRRLLEQDGYTVVEAEHGREALARLPEISPGLILLDLMMPEMDGFEFVVELRRHEAWRAIPVIVITARDLSAEDRRRLNGYVEKVLQKGAYSRDALLAEVRELVAASIARRRGAR